MTSAASIPAVGGGMAVHRTPGQATRAAFALLLSLLLAACGDGREVLKLTGDTMGTQYHITVVSPEPWAGADLLQAAVDRRLSQLNQTFSTYIEESELNRFNRSPPGEWQKVSADLQRVLFSAMQIGWLSGGAFDVTVSPLVKLWGFGPGAHTENMPSEAALAAALERVGFQNIELDIIDSQARRTADVDIDLSAIAKGYAVDAIAALLVAEGATDFMVEIGGEVFAAGRNPHGEPWRIAVERPLAAHQQHLSPLQPLRISGVAVATSGDYRNYFERDGVRYSHTIDPTTGRPVTHALASVSVIAESAMTADALATAFSVMGPERSLELAEHQGIAVFLIVRRGDGKGFHTRYSSAFQPFLESSGAKP